MAPSRRLGPDGNPSEHGRLLSHPLSVPHPNKRTDGEDAFFVSVCKRAVGVADGVGGWADYGVDSGKFSRELMNEARRRRGVARRAWALGLEVRGRCACRA